MLSELLLNLLLHDVVFKLEFACIPDHKCFRWGHTIDATVLSEHTVACIWLLLTAHLDRFVSIVRVSSLDSKVLLSLLSSVQIWDAVLLLLIVRSCSRLHYVLHVVRLRSHIGGSETHELTRISTVHVVYNLADVSAPRDETVVVAVLALVLNVDGSL